MQQLKYVVFGLRNVIVNYNKDTRKGCFSEKLFNELTKLIIFLRKKNIEPIVYANKDWIRKDPTQPLEEIIKKHWGEDIRYFITTRNNMPRKPRPQAIPSLLKVLECEENEILFIGNSNIDMQAAVNGRIVFLNATWFGQENKYGFIFDNPKSIAKFVDTFFCRQHLWSFKIEVANLRYYSLAPYGTYDAVKELYGNYSSDARRTAKDGLGHPEFWGRYLSATSLLSGIYKEVDYICPFPSHSANKWRDPLQNSIDTFEKCFRHKYLKNLIVRHTSSLESHTHRDSVNHITHLNTIRLNPQPDRPNGKVYKKSPLVTGKTVLVIDDFCTQGYSLEAARIYLAKTGVNVILFSWLKTINRPYIQLSHSVDFEFDPYAPNDWTDVALETHIHDYESIYTDKETCLELNKKFESYVSWNW